jgi:hypothetical protein
VGKSSSSPAVPQQPSPVELAEAQARANRITQFTPGGTLEFGTSTPTGGFTPEGGRALRLTETPAQKAIRQLQEIGGITLGGVGAQLAGQLPTTPLTAEGLTARPDFDLSGVRAIPGEQDQAALEQQYTSRALELLQPELQRTEERQIQDLANIGQPEGSEFFEDVQRRYGNQRASLLSAIAQDAIGRGEARQADVFGRELTRRQAERGDVLDRIGYGQQRRQSELAERVGLRQQAQQELTGLLTGQMLQTPQLANFVPPGQIDVLGPYAMQQNAALQRAQIASQDRAATLGALGSLGGGALGGWAQGGFRTPG